MKPTTYVFNDTEVKTTGRQAIKPIKPRSSTRNNNGNTPTALMLHEITPVNMSIGTWTKWVVLKELFKIST